jgi:hypothetical protein
MQIVWRFNYAWMLVWVQLEEKIVALGGVLPFMEF